MGYKTVSDKVLQNLKACVKSLFCKLGTPNGIATLDGTGNVPVSQLANAGGGGGTVSSVFGRTGAVVALANDYAFAELASKPTTIAGYGITDPIVLTSGSYSNPSWITGLAWSKISTTPTTISGYGITDGVTLTGTQTLTNKIITGYQPTVTLTTTGSSGAATFVGNTLNIPNYISSPGGSNTQLQYNNAGTFGGISGATTNGTILTLANGSLALSGSTSGTTLVNATAIASGTLTLPATTDTLIGKATTDTLTNKTFNTAGTGNVFQINGTGITAINGTGAVVLTTSPALITPTLGVATATSVNKVTITAPTTSATLTLVTGSSLITAGAFATTLTSTATTNVTLPTSGTLYGTATGSITSAQLATSLTDETGTGANVFGTSPTLTTATLTAPKFKTSVVSGTTQTLDLTATVWIFSGSTATVWTLPALTGNTDLSYFIKNRGSATITLTRAGSDNLYTTTTVISITINPGEGYQIINDGSFWLIL